MLVTESLVTKNPLIYFTHTRLNLYLDQILVIEYQCYKALWKAYDIRKLIAMKLPKDSLNKDDAVEIYLTCVRSEQLYLTPLVILVA